MNAKNNIIKRGTYAGTKKHTDILYHTHHTATSSFSQFGKTFQLD